MRKVAVVGAGQAGLHLAIALVDRGYDVTMMAERSAEEILASPATGISALFGETLDLEESLGPIAPWTCSPCASRPRAASALQGSHTAAGALGGVKHPGHRACQREGIPR